MLGTSWGQEGAKLVPAPGDPWYATYTYDPLHAPFSPPPAGVAMPPVIGAPTAPAGAGFTDPALDPQADGVPHLPAPGAPGPVPGPPASDAGGN